MDAPRQFLEFGPFRIDPELCLLFRDNQPVPLSPKAFELLLTLVRHNGQIVLKDDLMKTLWPDSFVEESNLGQYVFQLRKALGEQAQNPTYIVTVSGRGYRFAHRVRTISLNGEGAIAQNGAQAHVLTTENLPAAPNAIAGTPTKSRLFKAALVAGAIVMVLLLAAFLRPVSPPPRVLRTLHITHSGQVELNSRVFADVSRFYFTERIGGTQVLAQAPISGGEPTLISTSVPNPTVFDIDPAQSRLLVLAQGVDFNNPVWVVPTTGGTGQRLADVLASEAGAWAFDRHGIIYSHDTQIDAVRKIGEKPVPMLTTPGYVVSLRVSPDGNRLSFSVRDAASGAVSLWEATADGRDAHPLSFGWKTGPRRWGDGECCGDWTPDGKYFVFRSLHDGVDSFWAVREGQDWLHRPTKTPVQLYTSPDHLGEPRFTPDGKKLIFAGFQERRELVRYDRVRKFFVPYLDGIPARLLSFSKDGKWVSYRNETDGSLWRCRADGTEKLQLTVLPMQVGLSSWSPDGKKIVFEGRLPEQTAKLFTVSADGGNAEALTSGDSSDTGPDWSADGRSIVFQRWTPGAAGDRWHPAIYTLDLKTREAHMLPGGNDFDGVHLSPDGKYAAATQKGTNKIMLFDFARQSWSYLAEGPGFGWGMRWSSDSRYIYYQHSNQGEEQPIVRVRISDRRAEQITSAHQILRADILSYTMTGLTPDDSPLASLVHRNSDISVLELDLP